MPVLEWIGKQAVINHHLEVPYRLLKGEDQLSVGEYGNGNLLVEGDNLEALKALLPHYAGQVKCIYIDPPYNTGNENWVYNDNVNSPEIRRWLNKVVGSEAEDLSRHDKWLCMMYPRLRLLREFLSNDGAIFVSIDDHEVAHLRCMMDEVFGARHFVGNIVWQHSVQPKGYTDTMSVHHNHVICYSKSGVFVLKALPRTEEHNRNYSNPDDDPRGPWRSGDVRNALYRPNLIYDIITPSGKKIPPPPKGWRWSRETLDHKISTGEIVFSEDETRIIRKIYLSTVSGRAAESIWFGEDVGTTRDATQELKLIFDGPSPIDTPKPTRFIKRILQIASEDDSLIMDSFAGSGTTGHAVLEQNREDGGNRRFILVELEADIARDVTRERLRRVIEGYSYRKPKGGEVEVEGLGGGFRYCTLGGEMFDRNGRINPEVTFQDLGRHVWFAETREPLLGEVATDSPLLGVHRGTAYYLLYNGVLKDRSPGGGNVLTRAVLESLPYHEGRRVVYGVSCRLGAQRLRSAGVEFRHIPYEVEGGQ